MSDKDQTSNSGASAQDQPSSKMDNRKQDDK